MDIIYKLSVQTEFNITVLSKLNVENDFHAFTAIIGKIIFDCLISIVLRFTLKGPL